MITLPPQVNTALAKLEASGFEAFVVGGAVRDHVMDKHTAKDWDITTNALPQEVKVVFQGFNLIETGLKHGTVTAVIDEMPVEITTYRIDGHYSDHRRPDKVSFTRSLMDDLMRRDFTMNALAYNPKVGIVDYYGGIDDIQRGLVRCVGDPDSRFQEDGLRMLRAIRFASVYDMQIDEATIEAIHHNKELLKNIAVERIQVELTKMLCGRGVSNVLRDFADIIAVCIPDITPMFAFEQHNPHHDKNVWNHTIAVVSNTPAEPILRWSALLHDIGKPSCFSLADDGIGHFYGHAEISTKLTDSILYKLKFDTASRERIIKLVRYHDLPIAPEKKTVKRLMNKLGVEVLFQLIELHKADTLGQSAICMNRIAEYDKVATVLNEILHEEACFSLKSLAVNGNDMLALGLFGKDVGTALNECLNAVIDESVSNNKADLLAYIISKI